MKAQRDVSGHDGGAYRLSVPNVYEIAVASAREAKRINERFYAAGVQPKTSVVQSAIKRVIGGNVTYKVEPQDELEGGRTADDADGHS